MYVNYGYYKNSKSYVTAHQACPILGSSAPSGLQSIHSYGRHLQGRRRRSWPSWKRRVPSWPNVLINRIKPPIVICIKEENKEVPQWLMHIVQHIKKKDKEFLLFTCWYGGSQPKLITFAGNPYKSKREKLWGGILPTWFPHFPTTASSIASNTSTNPRHG